MTDFSELKQILLKMAHLPKTDQRWILGQLPENYRARLEQGSAMKWLQRAQAFKSVRPKITNPPILLADKLPPCCYLLSTQSPLYIAIVMEQGQFHWQSKFLQQFDKDGFIQSSLQHQVPAIKTMVKQALLNEWENRRSFDTYLDNKHG